jgi:hypothetical protein
VSLTIAPQDFEEYISDMTENAPWKTFLHLGVRIISGVTFALYVLGMSNWIFTHLFVGILRSPLLTDWFGVSTFVVSAIVCIETILVQKTKIIRGESLRIDAIFAVSWSIFFWATVIYGITHYATI